MHRAAALVAFLALLTIFGTVGEVRAAAGEEEVPAAIERAPAGYARLTLQQALQSLRAQGLRIIFSSNVVHSSFTIEAEPLASDPRLILDELLAQHALEVQEGPGETLIVVQAPSGETGEPRFIGGFVRVRGSDLPVSGAVVRDLASGAEANTDSAGQFLLTVEELGTRTLEARSARFLTGRLEGVSSRSDVSFDVIFTMEPVPTIEERLVVAPSRISLLEKTPVAPLSLGRQELEALPHLGGDFYRALTLLPGTTGNDTSAQFYVRGGRRDETQILMDGQELYEGFHLKDRDSALSLISPEAIGAADLNTGGFGAEYGDRMSGVLDMTTVVPSERRRFILGLGVLSAHAGGGGVLPEDRGHWVAQVRRGTTDLVGRLLGAEDPEFWDVFGKLERQLGPRQSVRFNLLASRDVLDFSETIDGESKQFETEYGNAYAWLTHRAFPSSKLVIESSLSAAWIDRDRRGVEDEEGAEFLIVDDRDSEILSARQRWNLLVAEDHSIDFGWQLRELDTEYDYVGTRNLEDPLAQIRHDFETDLTAVVDEFEDLHQAVHVANRFRPRRPFLEPLTLELGLRWDAHSLTDEDYISPRFNLAWATGEQGVVRFAWGRFTQSQRPYELSVEDGESYFKPIEKAEHRILGFERFFESGADSSGVALRLELYQREVDNPRPQYVNLFEPLNTFPEVEPDRVLIEPDRSRAEGFEVFLRSGFGRKVGWWANYSYSVTEDLIGDRWTSRLFDQTHALNLDVDYRISDLWRINAAWRYHTGWPTTPLTLVIEEGEDEDGEPELEFSPVLGPLNSERVADYHRLDVRLSREWRARWGLATFFLDVQNLYDRENVAGFDIEIDDEEGSLHRVSEAWAGILPSAGVRFEF